MKPRYLCQVAILMALAGSGCGFATIMHQLPSVCGARAMQRPRSSETCQSTSASVAAGTVA